MVMTKAPGYRWIIMLVCFLTLTCGCAYLSIWSMIIQGIMAEFNVTSATAQLGNSFLLAGYAVASYILSILAAKIGRKKASLIGLTLFLIGTFAIPFCDSFGLILILRFLQGGGIVWGINVGMAAAWFPAANRGLASGLVGAGLCVGTGFGGWYAATLWNFFHDWRGCFLNGGYLFLAFIVLFLLFAKDAPADLYPEEASVTAPAAEGNSAQRSVWRMAGAWLAALSLFMICWVCTGFQTALPQYYYSLGYSMTQAGNALFVNGLLGIILTPMGGMLSDAFIKRGVQPIKSRAYCMAIGGFLPSIVALVLCPYIAPVAFSLAMLVAILQSSCAPIGNASLGALPLDLLGDPILADKMFGMTILVGLSGGVIVPYVVSTVQNAAGWPMGFFVVALGAFAGMVIGFITPRFKPQTGQGKQSSATEKIASL